MIHKPAMYQLCELSWEWTGSGLEVESVLKIKAEVEM